MNKPPTIAVLAGVNGAGKSSVAGGFLQKEGDIFFNPDTIAQKIRDLHPDISLTLANAHAWQIGKSLLEQAIAGSHDYRFETTLGGRTIAQLLEKAARSGHRLQVWFCGLASADLHIRRVRSRVAHGGHDIPVEKTANAGTAAAKTSSACSPASTICASMTIHRKPTPPKAGSPSPFCSSKCNAAKSPPPPTSPTPPTGPSPSSPPPSTCTPQSRARRPRRDVSHRGHLPLGERTSPPFTTSNHRQDADAISRLPSVSTPILHPHPLPLTPPATPQSAPH